MESERLTINREIKERNAIRELLSSANNPIKIEIERRTEDIKEAIEIYEQRYWASKKLDDTDGGIHGIRLEYDTAAGARLERARRYQFEAEATDGFLDRTKRNIDGTKADIDAANSFLSDLLGRIREFIRRKWDALMERIKNRQYDYYEVEEAIEHHEEVIEELKEGEQYQGPIMM